jgi:hypothetical protein
MAFLGPYLPSMLRSCQYRMRPKMDSADSPSGFQHKRWESNLCEVHADAYCEHRISRAIQESSHCG